MLRGTGISTHVPRTGHDRPDGQQCYETLEFQSTRPLRGTTYCACCTPYAHIFQSTCPVRGTTTWRMPHGSTRTYFNPRAPYGARQCSHQETGTGTQDFNPRAPYGARRGRCRWTYCPQRHFNPRAPYGARRWCRPCSAGRWHFNPRAPYGARLPFMVYWRIRSIFQSTRPLRGATRRWRSCWSRRSRFQSTRPLRGATHGSIHGPGGKQISIHAPLTGRDCL